jgi:hypothetical protein
VRCRFHAGTTTIPYDPFPYVVLGTWSGREQFDISGVPIIVFLDARGQEWTDMRVEGFVDAGDLLRRAPTMRALGASGW